MSFDLQSEDSGIELDKNRFAEFDDSSDEEDAPAEEVKQACWGQSTIFHLLFFLLGDFTLIFMELLNISNQLGLNLFPSKQSMLNLDRVEISLNLLRTVLYLIISITLIPSRWYKKWVRLDNLVPPVFILSISLGFLVIKNPPAALPTAHFDLPNNGSCEVSCGVAANATKPSPFANLNLEFESLGLVLTFFIQWIAKTGTLRTMLKYYDWSIRSITWYKTWRFFLIILVISGQNFVPYATGSVITYFGAMVSVQTGMLSQVISRSDEVRAASRAENITQSIIPKAIYKRLTRTRNIQRTK